MSKHEGVRAVEVANLDDVLDEDLAERIRAQIAADDANLRSGVYLVPYEKDTQASMDRKKKFGLPLEAAQNNCPHCSKPLKKGKKSLGYHRRYCTAKP